MQIEILLANLLFGLTILTGAIALAHLVGDLLLGQRNYNPKLRKAIRSLVVGFAIAVCLASYLYLLAQPGRTDFSLFATRIKPFLPAGYLIANGQSADALRGDRKLSVQEYAVVGAERVPRSMEPRLRSHLMQGSEPILYRFVPQFDVAENLPHECTDWLVQLEVLTASNSHQGVFSRDPKDKIDVFCASAPDDHTQWRLFSQARAALVIGAVGEKRHKDLSVFASSWGQIQSGDVAVAFTGWDIFSTPIPFGLRLFFGREWISKSGVLAQTSEQEFALAIDDRWRPKGGANAALIKRRVNDRRLLWTSLPATLHGKLHFSYDAYWQLLKQHIHGWLSGIPEISPAIVPTGRPGAVITLAVSPEEGVASSGGKRDQIFVETTDGIISNDIPQAVVRGLKFTGNPINFSRYDLLRALHQSSLALRDSESPNWTVLDIQDQALLAPALSLGFDAVIQPGVADRLVPLSMQLRHLKKNDPESMVASSSPQTDVLVMKGPSLHEAQGGIALEQIHSKDSSLSMPPRLLYGPQGDTEDHILLSEYLDYLRARSDILIQPGRRDGRNFWQIVNLGSYHFRNLVLHYQDKERVRIKAPNNLMVRVTEPGLGGLLGSLVLSELKPGEAVLLEWEQQ